jgi:hypothetical protein
MAVLPPEQLVLPMLIVFVNVTARAAAGGRPYLVDPQASEYR